MARTRLINPAAPMDEDVARLSMAGRLLWAYLPCHADREGRLKDSAFTLRAAIFPGDTVDVDALLAELAAARHIVRYEVDGRRFIQIRNFAKYQSPHKNEAPSSIPAPSETVPLKECREPSGNYTSARSHPVSDPDPVPEDPPPSAPARDPSTTDDGPASEASGTPAPAEFAMLRSRPPQRPYPLGAKTLAFKAVFERYPRKDAENRAAGAFQEIAHEYPGGEDALSQAILAAFDRGILKRAPYFGPNDKRPYLETFLAERRWEDPASAPDDKPAAKPTNDTRCSFHRAYGTLRKLPPGGPVDGCPACKELAAFRRDRAGEVTSTAEAMRSTPIPKEWTKEQQEEAEQLRRETFGPAPPVAAKAGGS